MLRVLWSLLTSDYGVPDLGHLVWQGCHFLRSVRREHMSRRGNGYRSSMTGGRFARLSYRESLRANRRLMAEAEAHLESSVKEEPI